MLDPARALGRVLLQRDANAKTQQRVARLSATYALYREADSRLYVEEAPKTEALVYYDEAARLDRTVNRVSTRIRAHLLLAPEAMPEDMRLDAQWLVAQDGKAPAHRRLLAQVIGQQAKNAPDDVKRLGFLTELRKACDESWQVCRTSNEDYTHLRTVGDWEREARTTITNPILTDLVGRGRYKEAREWADRIEKADPLMAALVRGRCLSIQARGNPEQWKHTRTAHEAVLGRATRKGDLYHISLRAQYLEALTEISVRFSEEKVSAHLLKEQAEKLIELLEKQEPARPEVPDGYQGWAHGTAGLALGHTISKLNHKGLRINACNEARKHLEIAFEKYPTSPQSGLWYLVYGDATLDLFELESTYQNEALCHATAKRIEDVLFFKKPRWTESLLEATKQDLTKNIQNLKAAKVDLQRSINKSK